MKFRCGKLLSRLLPQLPRARFEGWNETRSIRRELDAETDWEKKRSLQSELAHFAWFYEDQCQAIQTERLLRRARRLMLPVPTHPRPAVEQEDDPYWEQGSSGFWYLNPAGFSRVRSLIRADQKERREAWLAWMPLITVMTTFLLALIALLALLRG